MITDDEIRFIFSDLTTERRNVEFKQSMNWNDNQTKFTITKSVLAFSNTRDGGYLVIGVEQNNSRFNAIGMIERDFNSFNNFDDIQSFINGKAEPPVNFERREYITPDEKRFFIIKIHEFDRFPIVCTQGGGNHTINKGVIYVRTMVMPQSAPIDNQTNLIEITNMIIDKHSREFYARIEGMRNLEENNEESFEQELEDL
jgi:hypothetical protein